MVPYRIQPSKIHGNGVFACTFIKEGTLVWHYAEPTDRRIFTHEKGLTTWLDHVAYRPPGKNYREVPGDGAVFLNHSDAPNITVTNDAGDMMANRDIANGEEITCNYKEFDIDPESDGKLK